MTVNISEEFLKLLTNQVHYIYKDKPRAALKFRKDLLKNIRKELKHPFHFKKSKYFDDENIRDYAFKGYVSVYEIDIEKKLFLFLDLSSTKIHYKCQEYLL